MEQYKIRPGGFNEIRKAILRKTIPILLVATLVGISLPFFNPSERETVVIVFPFVLIIVLGALAFGLYRGVNRQKVIFDSYLLTLDSNGITREQNNTPTITISNSEITEIIKHSNGSFTIKGNSSLNAIVVPSQIDDYGKLENSLSSIRQISTKNKEHLLQMFRVLLSIVAIGLQATVFIAKNKIIVGISGIVLLVLLGYSFFEVQRSKNVDNKTKMGMWVLIIVMTSIIGIMYFKLTAKQ